MTTEKSTKQSLSANSLDQAVRDAVKEEIGDVEDMKFPEKHMLHQKFGVIPAIVTKEEILYWEMREQEGDSYAQ
jgi:hypothetical protein